MAYNFYFRLLLHVNRGFKRLYMGVRGIKNALRIDLEQLKVIVTDNEDGLENVIEDVFPNAKHQLCTWHIEKKILAKLSEKFAGGTESESVQDIIKEWTAL